MEKKLKKIARKFEWKKSIDKGEQERHYFVLNDYKLSEEFFRIYFDDEDTSIYSFLEEEYGVDYDEIDSVSLGISVLLTKGFSEVKELELIIIYENGPDIIELSASTITFDKKLKENNEDEEDNESFEEYNEFFRIIKRKSKFNYIKNIVNSAVENDCDFSDWYEEKYGNLDKENTSSLKEEEEDEDFDILEYEDILVLDKSFDEEDEEMFDIED